MRELTYTVVIEPDEGAFHACVPAAGGCHMFGDTVEEATANVRKAIALHVEGMLLTGEEAPVGHGPLVLSRISVPLGVILHQHRPPD
ncbi:MAG: type II toxin-antitoxin system HicB family antitoxin [Dehalococcoidia bacterium]